MSNEASMSTSSTEASTNTAADSTRQNQSYTSYLGDTSLYIPNKDFFMLIQETGQPYIDPRTGFKYNRKPTKTHYDKNNDSTRKHPYSLFNFY